MMDDVDRLFVRLDRAAVPDDLTARVLASTVARKSTTRAIRAWPWMLAALVALGVLIIAGYDFGASLATSDGLTVFAAIFSDLSLLTVAPGDVLAALNEVMPWTVVGAAGVSATLLVLAAGHLASRGSTSLRARRLA
jgi:hypothetical protein